MENIASCGLKWYFCSSNVSEIDSRSNSPRKLSIWYWERNNICFI